MIAADSSGGIGAGIAMLVVLWLVSGLIGLAIGSTKGKAGAGFALGLFLGVLGWIITACLSKSPQKQAQEYAEIQRHVHHINQLSGYSPSPQMVYQAQPPSPTGWHADPFGRHQHRFWDGYRWTEYVADGGVQSADPPVAR